MHLKRRSMPKGIPIPKTGTKYLALADHNQGNSIALVILMRDILKLIKTKKELKKALNEKKILVNSRLIKETNYPVSLFDSLSIPSINKHYKLILMNKKLATEEVSAKKAESRIYKIIGKTKLPGNKIQLNLSNGKNILSSEKLNTGDFVILDNLHNKIIKSIQLKKGTGAIAIKGKHNGKEGIVQDIVRVGENEIVILKSKEGELKINLDNIFAKEQD